MFLCCFFFLSSENSKNAQSTFIFKIVIFSLRWTRETKPEQNLHFLCFFLSFFFCMFCKVIRENEHLLDYKPVRCVSQTSPTTLTMQSETTSCSKASQISLILPILTTQSEYSPQIECRPLRLGCTRLELNTYVAHLHPRARTTEQRIEKDVSATGFFI